MYLEEHLINNRSSIIKKWRGVVLGTYPEGTQRFLTKEKSRFANPVGHVIDRDIETLYDELIKGEDKQKIASCLDNIIRIRAVQDFKPSHAVSFVLDLKRIVREELAAGPAKNGLWEELQVFETRVDDVALLAFDVYSQCRQKIYDIRVKEVKNQVERLLKRANLVCEIPEKPADI